MIIFPSWLFNHIKLVQLFLKPSMINYLKNYCEDFENWNNLPKKVIYHRMLVYQNIMHCFTGMDGRSYVHNVMNNAIWTTARNTNKFCYNLLLLRVSKILEIKINLLKSIISRIRKTIYFQNSRLKVFSQIYVYKN